MPYQLRITRSAAKELRKLPPEAQQRIRQAVRKLADDPRPSKCKKLQGRDDYRVTVGDYRVIYEVDDDAEVVTVWRVGHRRNVYRGI